MAAADSTAGQGGSILGVAIRDASRLREVVAVVMRHGFGEFVQRMPFAAPFVPAGLVRGTVEGTPAERFSNLLAALGPTYIKLGQLLSMRSDLLPPDWIKALEKLQDRAPEIPYADVERAVEQGLGRPIGEIFSAVEKAPLATASIGQTHMATTTDGRRVVIKVQRPGIATKMRGDLDLLFLAAKALEASIDEMRVIQPALIVGEFEKGLLKELNFTSELANLVTLRRLLPEDGGVTAPEPYPELSCRTVLTMKYFDGKPVREIATGSPEAKRAVETIVSTMCRGVFADGFFHGDPHAGNILVAEDGTLCFLDLGLVGTLSPEQRDDLVTLVLGTIANDASTIARVLLKIGKATQRVDIGELKTDITRVRSEFVMVSRLRDVDTRGFVDELARAVGKYRVRLATEYSVLAKAAGTIEGLVRALYPDLDFIPVIRPHVEKAFGERWEPTQLLTQALGGATGLASLVRTVPTHVDQILHDFETGNVQVRPLVPTLDQIPDRLHDGATRIAVAIFAAAMTIASALSLPTGWASYADKLRVAFFVLTLVNAVAAWTVTWWWHWLGRGVHLRLSPLLDFFRRGRS